MKKMSILVEAMEEAVEILNLGYSEDQWKEKKTIDYMRLDNAFWAFGSFESHRDLEEIEWDVDVDEDKLRALYAKVEIALEDYEDAFGAFADGKDFYDLLLYYTNKIKIA